MTPDFHMVLNYAARCIMLIVSFYVYRDGTYFKPLYIIYLHLLTHQELYPLNIKRGRMKIQTRALVSVWLLSFQKVHISFPAVLIQNLLSMV